MNGFDLEQLRTLVVAVDAGSLTAAAPRRFLSQSALSEQLRKLEAHAGQPLLVRSKTGVVPTEAGTRLLVHARSILTQSDVAWRDLHGVPLQGELRLAVTDYFRPAELARLLARLGQRHPQVRLHVHVLKSDAIEAGYERGDFDIALSMRIAGQGTGRASGETVLLREPLVWAATEGATPPPRGEALRLVLLPESCALHRLALEVLARRRVPCVVAHVASGVAGLQSAVAAGLGVGCLNMSALGAGVARLQPPHRLPALPQAVFRLLPARPGETPLVPQVRQLLAAEFA